MFLLDVNLLIALCDADHVHRDPAKRWFRENAAAGWATCPLTENALLRIMGHPAYPGGPGSPWAVMPLLRQLRSLPGYQFWEDVISLSDSRLFSSLEDIGPKGLTDIYLLALAVNRGGRFATLDTRVDPAVVSGGKRAMVLISV